MYGNNSMILPIVPINIFSSGCISIRCYSFPVLVSLLDVSFPVVVSVLDVTVFQWLYQY